LNNIRPHIAQLAPLMPQLGFALRRRAGDVPELLTTVGGHRERHIAMLISLGIAGPAPVSDLAARLRMTTAHASLVAGDLAKAGLVEREHDSSDRRRVIVSLSEAAKGAVAQMRERNAAPLVKFLAGLNDDEAREFIRHLSDLVVYLNE